jgi:hypothetical protein
MILSSINKHKNYIKSDRIICFYEQQYESEAKERYEKFLRKEEKILKERNSLKEPVPEEKILSQYKAENEMLIAQAKALNYQVGQKSTSICYDLIQTLDNTLFFISNKR